MYRPHRRPARRQAPRRQVRYAASQDSRLGGSWFPATLSVNDLISQANPTLRQRVRQLVRDFPPFARAVSVLTDYIVGTGIRFQSRAVDAAGNPDRRAHAVIEEAFQDWMREADVAGRLHFYDLQRLACRMEKECGEFLGVFRSPRRPGRHPLALHMLEPEQLGDVGATPGRGSVIFQGVEVDAQTGESLAYHLADPVRFGRSTRVSADDVVHGFAPVRAGQVRGVTVFAPAILLARDLDDYMGAEVDAAKMASKWLAIVQTSDPVGFQEARGVDPQAKIEELENAILEYLQPGEEIKAFSHDRPGDGLDRFSRLALRFVSIACDVPYELLSGDYQGVNYSTLRAIRNDFRQSIRPQQERLVQQLCQPVFERWLDTAVLRGDITLPGYWSNPARYRRGLWIPAGMAPVDPLKESKSDVEQINARLKAPQEVIQAQGRDPEKVLDQLKEWEQLCEERGLDPWAAAQVSTALATNPAALDDDDDEQEVVQ